MNPGTGIRPPDGCEVHTPTFSKDARLNLVPQAGADDIDDSISVSSLEVHGVVGNLDRILAALGKAGVPLADLRIFQNGVLADLDDKYRARPTLDGDDARFISSGGGAPTALTADDAESDPKARIFLQAPIERLQSGLHGFAAVWKRRWVMVQHGGLCAYDTAHAPDEKDSIAVFIPLSCQQTRVQLASEPMCNRLGREFILCISAVTAIGKPRKEMLLAMDDGVALQKWTKAIERASLRTGAQTQIRGATIFKACQMGDIARVKALLKKGVFINKRNTYGCTPLHYAVKHAAREAVQVAQGSLTQQQQAENQGGPVVSAQTALRLVVMLMANGADSRARDEARETPSDLARRLTKGFPRASKLLLTVLETSEYEVKGPAVYIIPNTDKLEKRVVQGGFEGWANVPQKLVDSTSPDPRRRGTTFTPNDGPGTSAAAARVSGVAGGSKRHGGYGYSMYQGREPLESSAVTNGNARKGGGGGGGRGGGDDEEASIETFHGVPVSSYWGQDTLQTRPSQMRVNLFNSRPVKGTAPAAAAAYGQHATWHRRERQRHGEARGSPSREGVGGGRGEGGGGGGGRNKGESAAVGVMFTDYRLGRASGVNVGARSSGRGGGGGGGGGGGQESCRGARRGGRERALRPGTSASASGGQRGVSRGSRRLMTRAGTAPAGGATRSLGTATRVKHSMPDATARRIIRHYMDEAIRQPNKVAGSLTEQSRFVSFSEFKDVYAALGIIKGDGDGELLPLDELKRFLSNQGEPLTDQDFVQMKQEMDEAETGYLHCRKFAAAVTQDRLPTLPDGVLFQEKDDIVLQMKRKRLAKQEQRQKKQQQEEYEDYQKQKQRQRAEKQGGQSFLGSAH